MDKSVFSKQSLVRLEAIRDKLDSEETAVLILRLIDNVNYLNGCVVMGNGSDIDAENPLNNVFEYIKQLEQDLEREKEVCFCEPLNELDNLRTENTRLEGEVERLTLSKHDLGVALGRMTTKFAAEFDRAERIVGLKDYAIESNRINAERAEKAEASAKAWKLLAEQRGKMLDKAEADSKLVRDALYQLLNDCINFDGGKLSDCKMKQAQQALIDTEGKEG